MDEKSLIQRMILFLPGLIGLGNVLFQQTRGIPYLIVIEYLVFGIIGCNMYGLELWHITGSEALDRSAGSNRN